MDAFSFAGLMDRRQAAHLGCCARCRLGVRPQELAAIDAKEYAISALCPSCTAELEKLWEAD